jgi:tRNA(Arg) A34 adenosine deaminase TadA
MNALAATRTGQDLTTTTLWSTQQPCAMCAAAAEFTGVGTVRYMAPDPSAIATNQRATVTVRARLIGPADHLWIVVANVLFLLSIASSRGVDHPTVARNRELEPETVAIVVELIEGERAAPTLTEGLSQWAMLSDLWPSIVAASQRRASRLRPVT